MTGGIQKLDQESMRQNNERMIFEAVYNSKDSGITRPELAARSGLSLMAVSRITDLLQEQGVLVEHDTENGKMGRPARRVCIDRQGIVTVGVSVDVGGAFLGAMDPYGKILAFESHPIPVDRQPPEASLKAIAEFLHAFLEKQNLKALSSVGLVMPGIIDFQNGHLHLASQLHWKDVPVAAMLQSYAALPKVILENDVKARALAEARFGSGCAYNDSVLLTIGSGIGAGIIIGKSIYRGKNNMAGEIGHTSLYMNHRMCDCGRMGCAQANISEPAIMQEARKVEPGVDMPGLIAAYEEGRRWARQLLDTAAEYILMLIGMLANAYAPEAIILCGSLMDRCPPLRERITTAVREENAQFLNPTFALKFSKLGPDGNIIGAAAASFNYNIDQLISRGVPAQAERSPEKML